MNLKQLLFNKRVGLNHFHDVKVFIEYSNDNDDSYKNIDEYNPTKKPKILVVFHDIISNKKLQPIAAQLFIRSRKINIFLVFIRQSYLAVPKKKTKFYTLKVKLRA